MFPQALSRNEAILSCNLYMLEQRNPRPSGGLKTAVLKGTVTPIQDYNNWEQFFGKPVIDSELAVWLLKFLANIRNMPYEDLALCAELDHLLPENPHPMDA